MSALQTALSHPVLLGIGAALLVVGFLLCRWAARHDLKGLATDAAIQVAWNKGRLDTETDLGNHLKALKDETSHVKRATAIAGHATRHVLSRFVNWAGLAAMAGGLTLFAVAAFWK